MTDERKCRVCGCTDQHGCANADGEVCHWVEPDLCSACAPGAMSVEELACSAGLQNMLDLARASQPNGRLPEAIEEMLSDFFVAGWNCHSLYLQLEAEGVAAIAVPAPSKLILPGEDF